MDGLPAGDLRMWMDGLVVGDMRMWMGWLRGT